METNGKRRADAARPSSETSHADAWVNPGAGAEQLSPNQAPSYLILRLSTALSRRFNRDYAEQIGVGTPEVRLITLLHDHGQLKFKEFVEHSTMDKAQASRTLASLVRNGYIALHGPDGAAKRFTAKVQATLTPRGKNLYGRALKIAREHQLEILNCLSPAERRSLHDILHRLLAEFELDRP